MKLKPKPKTQCFLPKMPENTFELNEDSFPTLGDSDPWGKIMVWREDVGWSVIPLADINQYLAMKHTHWTYTPYFPYNKSVTELEYPND